MAHRMINYLKIREFETILDFGCALGYLVKALRLLGYDARGYDVSEYVLDNCDKDVEGYIHNKLVSADWCISKDVFEHLEEKEIDSLLKKFKGFFNNVFLVIPLGDGKKFVCQNMNETLHMLQDNQENGGKTSLKSTDGKLKNLTTSLKE